MTPITHKPGDSIKPSRNPMKALAFEEGGTIVSTANLLKGRGAAIDAASGGGSNPAPAPAPAPKPAPAAPSQMSGGDAYAAQAAQIEAEQAAQAKAKAAAAAKPKSFMSKLGFSEGGKIEGPGTATSDSIPATVAGSGEDILVSDGERILSVAQDALLQKLAKDLGFPSLDALLEQGTGKPVGPKLKDGLRAAEGGANPEEIKKNPINAPQNIYKDVSLEGMKNAVADAIPDGVKKAANDFSESLARPVNESGAATSALGGTSTADDRTGIELQRARNGTPQDAPVGSLDTPSNYAGRAKNALLDAGVLSPEILTRATIAPTATAPTSTAAPASVPVAATPTVTQSGPYQQAALGQHRAVQETNIQQGLNTSVNAGVTRQGNSFSGQNLTEDTRNPLTTMDLNAANASQAKANAIRQSILDENAGARFDRGDKSGIIEDTVRAESNALMDKWGRETAATNAMTMAANNPKASQAIAHVFGAVSGNDSSRNRDAVDLTTKTQANQTVQRGQDTRLKEAEMHSSTTERGQDITAQTAANTLAGNPLDNAVKAASIETSGQALKKAQRQDKMLEDIDAEQDPTKRRVMMDTLLASQGKNPSEHRYVKVGGGEVLGPDGFSKVKQAEGVFDTINQKFIPMNAAGAAPAAQAGAVGKVAVAGPTYASKAELQAAIKSGTVKPGQVVNTINGPFTVK